MIPSVTFLQSPYQNARDARYPLRAVVNHRIVGTLPSARRAFGLVAGDVGRRASSHFGIGYVNGVLTIDQYVPLDRMAWTNGDVREPTWSRIIPGVNPNLYTVTIEHEDGSSAGRGRVSAAVWAASMELQDLLVSGDAAAIRAKGIRGATDAIVAQLKAIPNDSTGFIDHHQIAGPNKPYCFRRGLDDPGFVEGSPSRRDRLLAALNQEDDMQFWRPVQEDWWTVAKVPGKSLGTVFYDGAGALKEFTSRERVRSVAESSDGRYRQVKYPFKDPKELLVVDARGNDKEGPGLVPIRGTRVPATGYGFPPAPPSVADLEERLEDQAEVIARLSGRVKAKDAHIADYPKG